MRISDWSSDVCSSDLHLGETVGLEGRLLYPEIGGRRVSWDRAIGQVAKRFADTIARHGPDSVAFYVSGKLRSEEHTSELQSLMRISYAVLCLKKNNSQSISLQHTNTKPAIDNIHMYYLLQTSHDKTAP